MVGVGLQSRPLCPSPLTCFPGLPSNRFLLPLRLHLFIFLLCHPQRLICISLQRTPHTDAYLSAIAFSFAILLVRLCAGSSDRSAAHLAARSYCDNPSILAPASSHAPKCLTFPRPHSFVHSFTVACSDPWPTFCRSVVAFFCGATFPCLQKTQSVHNRHTHLSHIQTYSISISFPIILVSHFIGELPSGGAFRLLAHHAKLQQ